MEMSTKERILQEASKLFAQNGYMATSMSDIAGQLNLTKQALYKHYTSKQQILDSIVQRMNQLDQERMQQYQMPEGTFGEMADSYSKTPLETIKLFSEVQFKHWTIEEFPCNFRKMLTIEQYRSEEMKQLYQMYLTDGPIEYMSSIFAELMKKKDKESQDPKQIALDFYGPIYLLICMYDNTEDKDQIFHLLDQHIERFSKLNGLD